MSQPFLRKSLLAAAIASAAVVSVPAQAYQFKFDNPDWQASIDTTISVGALWRVEHRDDELAANGTYDQLEAEGIATQIDKNDGDNNFDRGLASLVYKITPELNVSWKNKYGVKVSGTYFYDQVIMNGERDNAYDPCTDKDGQGCEFYPNNYAGKEFSDTTKNYAGSYGRMLDTYAWADFYLGEMPLTIQAGRQVINWGEALFTTGGVNTANYYDLNALMMPGSELREALLPLDSIYFSLGLTYNLTAEAFYQFGWKPNYAAIGGTYWSTSDSYPGHGTTNVLIDGEAAGASRAFAAYTTAMGYTAGVNYPLQQDQAMLRRGENQEPKDSGQFGFALRYLVPSLNYTNFSFYFTNTHAKIPVVGATLGESNWWGNGGSTKCMANTDCAGAVGAGGASAIGAMNAAHMIDTTKYFLAYPEDIQMYGFSFNTTIGKLALSGELAYRPTRYIINEVPDNLIGAVGHAAAVLGNSPSSSFMLSDHCVHYEIGGDCHAASVTGGDTVYFYDTAQSLTGALVGIYSFGPMFGADNFIAMMETGFEYLHGLNGDLHYASTASVAQSKYMDEGEKLDPNDPYATYLDPMSWGYNAVFIATYNGLIPSTVFKPSLRWSQDVNGNSAVGGNYMEGRKAATLTLEFLVKQVDVALSGTVFTGARYSNKLRDRDNVALSVSYSF